MNAAPLSPPPDVDRALLVRQAMDMDWPPAPAVDAFLELAIERLTEMDDPRELPPMPNRSEVEAGKAAVYRMRASNYAVYVPRGDSVAGRAIALLKQAGRPIRAGEIMRAIGLSSHKAGLRSYLEPAVKAGLLRRTKQGATNFYEAA